MRIKKKQIIEAAAAPVDTSSTTTTQQNKTTNPTEINKVKDAAEELDKEIKDSSLMAFMKVSENTFGDVDDFSADYIDYMGDKEEQNKQDYDEWLQTPEGQEYIKSLESLQESINLKNRKVIKTIKVKDLK